MGLLELLLNAVEHGNLGLTYADKSALLASGDWEEEIQRRLDAPGGGARQAELEFVREGTVLRFKLVDGGSGFEWQRYIQMDPARAFDAHGRGIAMARMLTFPDLEYHGTGNTVTFSLA
jgi:hypothetical protein